VRRYDDRMRECFNMLCVYIHVCVCAHIMKGRCDVKGRNEEGYKECNQPPCLSLVLSSHYAEEYLVPVVYFLQCNLYITL
jgi:hypothetical protein